MSKDNFMKIPKIKPYEFFSQQQKKYIEAAIEDKIFALIINLMLILAIVLGGLLVAYVLYTQGYAKALSDLGGAVI